jgi:transposase
VRTCAPVG